MMTRTQRKRIAARVLAAGGDAHAAASACGRSVRTVRDWRVADDDFAEMIEDARRAAERSARIRGNVEVALGGAYDALRASPYSPPERDEPEPNVIRTGT